MPIQIKSLTCIVHKPHYFVVVYLTYEDIFCKINGPKDYTKASESAFYGWRFFSSLIQSIAFFFSTKQPHESKPSHISPICWCKLLASMSQKFYLGTCLLDYWLDFSFIYFCVFGFPHHQVEKNLCKLGSALDFLSRCGGTYAASLFNQAYTPTSRTIFQRSLMRLTCGKSMGLES